MTTETPTARAIRQWHEGRQRRAEDAARRETAIEGLAAWLGLTPDELREGILRYCKQGRQPRARRDNMTETPELDALRHELANLRRDLNSPRLTLPQARAAYRRMGDVTRAIAELENPEHDRPAALVAERKTA